MTVPTFDSKAELKAFIERVERLEAEKKAISDDIRDIYAEAKARGFDAKALRKIVQLRKLDADERREQEAILDTYMHALGMAEAPERPTQRTAFQAGEPEQIGVAADRALRHNSRVLHGKATNTLARNTAAAPADPPKEEEPHAVNARPSGHQGGAALVAASSSDDDLDIPACLDRRGGGALRC